MNRIKASSLMAILLAMFALDSQAQQGKLNYWPYREMDFTLSSEYYQWREYLLDDSLLLTESGSRWGWGVKEHNYARKLMGVVYEIDLRMYTGRVNYDGKSQDAAGNFNSVETKTDYLGGRMMFMAGQRLTAPRVDMLGGLEVNSWVRSLRGARDSAGNYARGYYEMYRVLAGRAALGSLQSWQDTQIYFQAGLKYPLDVMEFASLDTITLFPRPEPSLFASVDFLRLCRGPFGYVSVKLAYDSYRFRASKIEQGFYQPASQMDAISVTLQF
ncbi:MAG: hypothetical protein OEW58_08425 [Gammaproteobacteria bacterium]|nr:hypothetical protein [Gammaproteobacteria bacterium]